jgi:hypothetical protein
VDIAGITVHRDERWMPQIARNVTMEGCGALRDWPRQSYRLTGYKSLSPSAATWLQFQVRAPMMAQHNWETALASVGIFLKDMETISGFADEMGCPAPLIHTGRH